MKRNLLCILLAAVSSLLIYTSCAKIDTTTLGSDLIPAVDNINTFQTILDVESDNVLMTDSTRTFSYPHAIGVISNDPEFGKTVAVTYFTLEPVAFGTYPFVKKDTLVIDSLILSLAYSSQYGDSNSVQTFEVREIDQSASFLKTESYKINHPEFPTVPALLGSKQVNFLTLNDSVRYANYKDTVKTLNELRIPLDTSFGRRFINFDTSTAFKNDSIFKTQFKGFEVKINEAGSPLMNALAYFNLTDNDHTKMTFYCRVMRNGKWDTIAPKFVFSNDPRASLISRSPAGGYLTGLQNGSSGNEEFLYLQSNPGSYAKLKIPGIDTLNNRVIHLAELIAEKIPSAGENFLAPPKYLFLDALNDAGDTAFTIRHDLLRQENQPGYDISVFGGALTNDRYVFNISRYLQKIVTNHEKNYTLRLYAPFSAEPYYMAPDGTKSAFPSYFLVNTPIASGRVIVGGGAHPTKRLRLRIIYSKI